jgi:hypothetical protein
MSALDPATEVPPTDVLPRRTHRPTPYLYSDRDRALGRVRVEPVVMPNEGVESWTVVDGSPPRRRPCQDKPPRRGTYEPQPAELHVLDSPQRVEITGIDTSVMALWLGHEHVDTTQIYLHADLELKGRAIARLSPPTSTPGRYRPCWQPRCLSLMATRSSSLSGDGALPGCALWLASSAR